MPSEAWQRRATLFLAGCQKALTSDAGRAAVENRCLNMDFAQRHGLGWNPTYLYEAPELWGEEPYINNKGNAGKLRLPAGLVIPTCRKSGLVSLKIRRKDWTPGDEYPKYYMVVGSGHGALVLGKPGLPVVVVESEMDALLIAQEAADLCSALALGSAKNRPHTTETEFLRQAPLLLVALDFDEPDKKGQRAGTKAWLWWKEHFTNAKRWAPVKGKDPLDMHKAGIPVRTWVEAGIMKNTRQDATQPEPLALTPAGRQPDIDERNFVVCPIRQGKWHRWYCSRCTDAQSCQARHNPAEVAA
jgi:hypothetical protein